MPSILFVHQNYPAQFGGIAQYLAEQGWTVVFATAREDIEPGPPRRLGKVHVVRFDRAREPDARHPYLQDTEKAVLNGQGLARTAAALAKGGFTPDVVVAHSGWGSGSFVKTVWPDTRLVQYLEWWYTHPAPDASPEEVRRAPPDRHARTLMRNLPFLLDFQQADLVLAPTRFQASVAPDFMQSRIRVLHDGVDCSLFRPHQTGDDWFSLPGLPEDAPILTYATRGMEPARGFPTFMAAASMLQAMLPELHVVVAGQDKIFYGARLPAGRSYKKRALAAHKFDTDRLHFPGLLPRATYASLLRRSNAHVYLTRPFVLSWSLIEAMASGCALVVSDVAPVREALPDGAAAQFVPMEDAGAVADAALHLLTDHSAATAQAQAARNRALRYDSGACYAELADLYRSLIANDAPSLRRA